MTQLPRKLTRTRKKVGVICCREAGKRNSESVTVVIASITQTCSQARFECSAWLSTALKIPPWSQPHIEALLGLQLTMIWIIHESNIFSMNRIVLGFFSYDFYPLIHKHDIISNSLCTKCTNRNGLCGYRPYFKVSGTPGGCRYQPLILSDTFWWQKQIVFLSPPRH